MKLTTRGLALLFAAALLSGIAFHGFWEKHWESRRAEAAREIVVSGNWAVPTLLGEPFITKPPLSYWSMAAVFKIFGTVNDRLSRLPSAVLTLGSLFLVMGMAKRWKRPDGTLEADPLTTGVIFATMPLVFAMGINSETEPYLLFFTCLSLWSYLKVEPGAPEIDNLQWRVLFALGLVGGFMIKGPLGWFFPLFGVLAHELTVGKSGRRLSLNDLWINIIAHVLLVVPWFILVYKTVPTAMKIWLGETVRRVGDDTFTTHREPFLYYIPTLVSYGPWILLLPWGFAHSRGRNKAYPLWPLLMFIAGLFFLSIASSKRAHYILSLTPGLCLALSAGVTRMRERDQAGFLSPIFRGFGWLVPLLSLAAMGVLIKNGRLPENVTTLGAALAALGGLYLLWVTRRGDAVKQLGVGLLAGFIAVSAGILPAVDEYRCADKFFERVAEAAGPDATVANWRNERFASSFYLNRYVKMARNGADLDELMPKGGWLVGEAQSFETKPPRSVEYLTMEVSDPFRPERKTRWVLYRVNPASIPVNLRAG